jgi:HEAT repeat protein
VAYPALRRLLGADSVHLRVVAAATLHRAGEKDVAPVIVKALEQPGMDAGARATLLARIYSVNDERVQAVVRRLIAPGAEPAVVEAAVWNVYLVRDAEALPALRRLMEEDADCRVLAGACLLLLGEVTHLDALTKALREERLPTSHAYKVKTFLGQARPVPVVLLDALLERLETEKDVYVARTLVEMLGEHGHAKAVPALRRLLDHDDAGISKAAFEALASMPGALAPEQLRSLLEEGSDGRRLAAADALRRADDLAGLPVALEILARGARDQDRWEAATVLGNFRTARVVAPLMAALLDPNTSVRANALGSLGTVLAALFPYRRIDLASTGYATTGPDAAREAAVARIRAWWQAHRDGGW